MISCADKKCTPSAKAPKNHNQLIADNLHEKQKTETDLSYHFGILKRDPWFNLGFGLG